MTDRISDALKEAEKAAYDAGQNTAKKHAEVGGFTVKYTAMAVVQDALRAYNKVLTTAAAIAQPSPHKLEPVTFQRLSNDVGWAIGGGHDFDESYHYGHQLTGINFNSLGRIVDKHRAEVAAAIAQPAPGGDAEYHLGMLLLMMQDLHPDDQCDAFTEALAFYNARHSDAIVAPSDMGYVRFGYHLDDPAQPAPGAVGEFTQYRRKQVSEMRPWQPGESVHLVSISMADRRAGSPKIGDMIARNPNNHDDQWLVAAQYFAENFEPACAPVQQD